jgi:methyl-accepting chemotaxis protein
MVTMTEEIAQASREQAHGVAEISKAMGQLDVVTQNNSQTSNDVSSSAVSLQDGSQKLHGLVGELSGEILGTLTTQNQSKPVDPSNDVEHHADTEEFKKAA